MYGLLQTLQAPIQFNWCGNGLQNNGGSITQTLWNFVGTNPVYISPNGTSPSILTNQKGTWNYTFVKTGKTTGTSTGTTTTSTSFTDTSTNSPGTTNYNLSIIDSNTGQKYTFLNSVVWGIV
jgi:hypothetical protein